ncbi:MAG: sigma-70 family RNA polymerase sigma factor [Verrucomicrobiaceae bacterium]|nr:sigma-70 family RNA polymerase sigma factor [Verrucomicrobiaceae bacterium]
MPEEESSREIDQEAIKQRDTLLGAAFPTTHWSLVFRAQKDGAEAAAAMDELCRRYWYPLYAYLRCRGYERADAQDLTQGFFLKAIHRGLIESADAEKGRLRTYLLTALNRHIADELRRENAVKRGGRAIVLPLECRSAEEQYANEPVDRNDPERLFLAAWARSVLERARQKTRDYYEQTGRLDMFDSLQTTLSGDENALPYRELAVQMKASETALRLQVFRVRQRFAKILRGEVAQTVQTPEELEEELTWLSKVLRGE